MHSITQETDGRGALITLSGVVSLAEINKVRDELFRHESHAAHDYRIWNLLGAEAHTLTDEQMRMIAMRTPQDAENQLPVRVAVVIRPGFLGGLDRLFHVYSDVWANRRTATFTNLDDARAWARGMETE